MFLMTDSEWMLSCVAASAVATAHLTYLSSWNSARLLMINFSTIILVDTNHVLYTLLPPPAVASQNYDLRPRPHNLQFPEHFGRLMDSNLITRMLYTDVYQITSYSML